LLDGSSYFSDIESQSRPFNSPLREKLSMLCLIYLAAFLNNNLAYSAPADGAPAPDAGKTEEGVLSFDSETGKPVAEGAKDAAAATDNKAAEEKESPPAAETKKPRRRREAMIRQRLSKVMKLKLNQIRKKLLTRAVQ